MGRVVDNENGDISIDKPTENCRLFDIEEDESVSFIKAAEKIIEYSRNIIVINMRFFDAPLFAVAFKNAPFIETVAMDGENFYYNDRYIVKCFAEDEKSVTRIILHSFMHFILRHDYNADRMISEFWDIACDIAVENLIIGLGVDAFSMDGDDVAMGKLLGLRKNVTYLTAERIYRHFRINDLSDTDKREYKTLFKKDEHTYFKKAENLEITDEMWKKISQRIKTEIGTFSKDGKISESLMENLKEATEDTYDYESILKRFSVPVEEIKVSLDEFDYIYYTYGLTHYDNMPFIEAMEYTENDKIRDFAIVLDTSASCKGSILKSFITETFNILTMTDTFSLNTNVHIIQCDYEVREDVVIKSKEDLDDFLRNGRLYGYGGTDYRPAFDYVNALIEKKQFEDFKGLIYFTDGYGIYPERAPEYDVMFVFLKEDNMRMEVPYWAIKVELNEEDIVNEHK